jgi:uncharacterized membrane protein YuzA (DUF378 family)
VIDMQKINTLDWVAILLVIIGGINWGLVGFFKYNLVDSIFGVETMVSRIIYGLVGLASLWMIYTAVKLSDKA